MRPIRTLCLLAALVLVTPVAAATEPALRPHADKLAPWTIALRDRQPEDAFAAVYRVGPRRLVFVAAKHSNREDSLTFRLIRSAFERFRFDSVIAEGFATARGPNSPSIFRYVGEKPRADGFVEAGELAPAALGAQAQGATLWGGEPHDLEVKARLVLSGVVPEDLLGFYVLRTVPQWIGERKLRSAGDPALRDLVTQALQQNRDKLQLAPTVLSGFDEWAAWYQAKNGKPIGDSFVTEEVGPLSDGRFGTNKIAYAVSLVRDTYLHELIVKHLAKRESVLVVFGASHLMIHRPALDAALGPPCYAGTQLEQASATC
jgi:hypothetical protein